MYVLAVNQKFSFQDGVAPGQVLGGSDRSAAHPATAAYTPADLAATILQALDVNLTAEIRDPLGQPLRVNAGMAIPWS